MVFANNIRNLRIQKGWSQEISQIDWDTNLFPPLQSGSGVTEPPLKKIKNVYLV